MLVFNVFSVKPKKFCLFRNKFAGVIEWYLFFKLLPACCSYIFDPLYHAFICLTLLFYSLKSCCEYISPLSVYAGQGVIYKDFV
jgi:hypothetical protein